MGDAEKEDQGEDAPEGTAGVARRLILGRPFRLLDSDHVEWHCPWIESQAEVLEGFSKNEKTAAAAGRCGASCVSASSRMRMLKSKRSLSIEILVRQRGPFQAVTATDRCEPYTS